MIIATQGTAIHEADVARICTALWAYLDKFPDMLDARRRGIVELINLLRAAQWVEVGL